MLLSADYQSSLSEPLWASVEDGEVLLIAKALDVTVSITPDAARETARRLISAANQAEAARAHLCE